MGFDTKLVSEATEGPIDLSPHLNILADPDSQFSIEQITAAPLSDWRQNQQHTFSAGFSESVYWLRLDFENSGNQNTNWILEVPYPLLDEISFYYKKAGKIETIKTGDQLLFSERPLMHRHFVFPIQLDTQSKQSVYFRIASRDTLQFPIRLWKPSNYQRHNHNVQLLYGLFFGALMVLIGMNTMALISLRDKNFLYYVAAIFFYAISQANLTGFTFEYLLSNFPSINKWMRPITVSLTLFFVSQFARDYLDTQKRAPLFYSLLNAISWVSIFSILMCIILPFSSAIKMVLANAVLGMLTLLATCIVCTPLKFAPARYFLFAWLGLIIGVCINILRAFGSLPSNLITEHSIEFGAMIVAIFLSYGLTSRVNEEKKLKLFAQREALRNERLARQEHERATQIQLSAQKKEFEAQQHIIAAQSESRAKSDFLATMSHEIRTPMNGVLGLTELLLETKLDPKQEDYLKTIHRSGESLLGILNDILDFSKVESKSIELENVEFSIESVVDDVISIFANIVSEKKLSINFVLHHETPRNIIGDPTRLRQVLLNLVSNSIKFTDHGEIVIRAYWEAPFLKFEVQDTGIGIAKEHQGKLFELFSQADQSTTRRYGGTGLGLAICRGLTELMGGGISVTSRVGHGSTFSFTIKCEDSDQIDQPKPPETLTEKSIILVDSNLRFIESMAELAEFWHAKLEIVVDPKDLKRDIYDSADLVICHQKYSSALPKTKDKKEVVYLADYSKREGHPERTVLQRPVTFAKIKETVIHSLGIQNRRNKDDEKSTINFHKLNVLVAEDNNVNRMVIKGILNKLGISPEFAVNGLLAVRAVLGADKPFDVILMDCEMPEMDGYQATKEIRQLEQQNNLDIKIIGVSAHAVMEREQMAYEAGMNLYMTKPIQIEDIKKVLLDIERGTLAPPQPIAKSSSA